MSSLRNLAAGLPRHLLLIALGSRRFIALGLTILTLLGSGCRCAETKKTDASASPTEAEILDQIQRREWRREVKIPWLRQRLTAPSAAIRARAALALGRLAYAPAVDILRTHLDDARPRVRRTVIFALRLSVLDGAPSPLKTREVIAALRTRLRVERDATIRGELLTTLGWIGDARERPLIEAALTSAQAHEAITAWGLLGLRKKLDRSASAVLRPFLRGKDLHLRRAATWAIAAAPATTTPAPTLDDLLRLGAKDTDPTTRANAVRAIASCALPQAHAAWLLARYEDPAMPVQIEASRGLARGTLWGKVKLTAAIKRLWNHLGASHFRLTGPRLHAVIAGIQALEDRASVATLRQLAVDMLELSDASDAAVTYRPLQALSIDHVHCAAARLWDLGSKRLDRSPTCGTARATQLDVAWRRRFVVNVIADIPQRDALWKLLLLRRYLKDPHPTVRSAAQDALARLDDPSIGAPLLRGLKDRDLGVFQAATRTTARRTAKLVNLGIPPLLLSRLETLNPVMTPESVCAIVDALAGLGARQALPLLQRLRVTPLGGVRACVRRSLRRLAPATPPTAPPPTSRGLPDLRWTRRPTPKLPQRAILVTQRGEVILELFPDLAPATVAFFARWAERRRYQHVAFDQIDPASQIVAGGRADGFIPPSYRLPCELTPTPFVRGSVGLTLPAGRDSAGMRFFITLRRRPELDGRRTLFARVVKGIELLDTLQLGEKIKDLYIPRPRGGTKSNAKRPSSGRHVNPKKKTP